VPPQIAVHPIVQVFTAIRVIDYAARNTIAEFLPVPLTVPEYEVLRLLQLDQDGLSPTEITRRLWTTKSTLTGVLKRLAADGLVRIEPCNEDGRRKRVWLAPHGRDAFQEAAMRIRPQMQRLREAFTLEEFRAALPFLKALGAWLEARDWEPPADARPGAEPRRPW
jgi:DNA-binding MarR family transcriptional regulator